MASQDNFSFENYHVYTKEEIISYGNRLHINTVIDIVINGVALYIVTKHSTQAMKTYKRFIMSTIISAFLLDFHITFIFGPFIVLPTPILCGASLFNRHCSFIWAHLIPYVSFLFP